MAEDGGLARLGLREVYLRDVVEVGERERRRATVNDPPNAGATFDYFARVRTLRERLIEREGWQRWQFWQSPLVINPDHTVAVGVLLGDGRTGLRGAPDPSSQRPVGIAKARLVVARRRIPRPTLELESEPELFPEWLARRREGGAGAAGDATVDDADADRVAPWFLLTFRYLDGDAVRIRSELSLATEVSPNGRMTSWADRIILPELRFPIEPDTAQPTEPGLFGEQGLGGQRRPHRERGPAGERGPHRERGPGAPRGELEQLPAPRFPADGAAVVEGGPPVGDRTDQ